MVKIELERVSGEFGFAAKDANNHIVTTDTNPEMGGLNYGARPMQMLLMALGGCSGIDVVSIMKKKRQDIKDFRISIEGEREAGKEPSLWQTVHVKFEMTGDLDPEKAHRACELSMDKYCSVAETLRRGGTVITWEVNVLPA